MINIILENKTEFHDKLITEIFGQYYIEHIPTNTEFLCSLLDYMNLRMDSDTYETETLIFICPDTGLKCSYYNNFLRNVVRQYMIEMSG